MVGSLCLLSSDSPLHVITAVMVVSAAMRGRQDLQPLALVPSTATRKRSKLASTTE